MQYNKNNKQKPYLRFGGPRDQQRRQQLQSYNSNVDSELITELRQQILELKKELSVPKGYYTGEQVDAEIRKAVEVVLKETSTDVDSSKLVQLEDELKKLRDSNIEKDIQINNLNIQLIKKDEIINHKDDIISNKDKTIHTLSSTEHIDSMELVDLINTQNKQINQLASALELKGVDLDPNRPKMQEVIIDPTGKKDKLESHIDVKDITSNSSSAVDAKVDKLKSLLGSLPSHKKSSDGIVTSNDLNKNKD